MSNKKTPYTPGPWRWGDWSATFGTMEKPERMIMLERNLTHPGPEPYVTSREDQRAGVLRLEELPDNDVNLELVRRAPELAAALNTMLDRYGGSMMGSEYELFRMLANPDQATTRDEADG